MVANGQMITVYLPIKMVGELRAWEDQQASLKRKQSKQYTQLVLPPKDIATDSIAQECSMDIVPATYDNSPSTMSNSLEPESHDIFQSFSVSETDNTSENKVSHQLDQLLSVSLNMEEI